MHLLVDGFHTHNTEMTEQITATEFFERARHIEVKLEVALSLPAFILNVYSIVKLRQLDALFPSLRIVMTTACGATAFLSILHPILHLIPPFEYSVKNGKYIEATVYYGCCFVSHVCFLMFESKYLVIAFERHLAFAYRNTFEKEGRRIGVKISVCYVVVAVLITTVKIVVYLYDPTEKTIDGLLHRAFFVEGPAMFFISCLVLSTVAWIFGIYKIHSFSQLVAQKLEFTSLTEKFIVKQVNLVLRFLKPLSLISFISVLVSTLCSIFVLVILMDGFNEHSASYKAAANAIFCSIASYNLFASVYNIYSFKPMNKLMKQDFHWFFKLNTRVNSVCNPQKSAAELQQEHFDNLEVIWTKTQPRPRSV